jgi:hypothetical protein
MIDEIKYFDKVHELVNFKPKDIRLIKYKKNIINSSFNFLYF